MFYLKFIIINIIWWWLIYKFEHSFGIVTIIVDDDRWGGVKFSH